MKHRKSPWNFCVLMLCVWVGYTHPAHGANNPVPSITSLTPASATAGAAAQTLIIKGKNFVSTSTVTYNAVAHTATYVSSTELEITLSASDQATGGTYPVVVTNPTPGGGASRSVNFTVDNPVPAITSLSPASATAGAAAQTLTINGTNFVSTSTVTYHAVAHTATYVSSTELEITLSASDQATPGTRAVVVTNPTPGGGASRSVNFTVDNPVPAVTNLSPASATVGAAAQTLIINGTNFVSTSTVTYNAVAHTATYVSSTELEIRLRASDLATAGTYPVVVTNPAPGGGASNSMNFTVGSPAPAITSLSPASATAGAAARTLIIKGTNFATTSTVTYNAVAHTATYVSSTELEITLSASDQATAGTYPVVVTNPAPGGGASNSVNFTVDNPPLAITSLSPASATVGAAAQTLIINGTNFVATSTVTYNAVAHTATYVSSTELEITLSATDQATAGTYPVVVTNPAPGGGTSNSVNFTVDNPAPAITTLSPASATAGAAAQTLIINGTNFVSTSTVTYHAVAHTATYVSSTELEITLSASDQATAGTYPVVVTNPAPGGGASNPVNFTVGNPVPAIISLSPASATAGAAAQTLIINGTNFVSTSTVTYNAVTHTATYVSSSELEITLSASDQATAGTYPVVVTNPAPGGGASNSVNFTVGNPVPAITSLSPASATAGAASQTLIINGTNFVATSTVTYNAVAHTPTYVSSTELEITLSATDQATAGTYPVVVTNPAPGGGASNSVNFTVGNPVLAITSLSPASATAGAASQTLTINGTNFVSTSTVTYNAVAHTPTYVSSSELEITLSASDQATAGTYPVVVTNPAPGGGTSNSVNFAVDNPVPAITTLSPASATAGAAAQTLIINGTNFVSTSTVTYNAVAHTPTYVSSTELEITLSATDQATAGTYPVIVTNPTPGGGASNSVNFTVDNPVPAITTLSPASTTAGAAAQTLIINGTNFVSTSTVTYHAVAHTATYISSTELEITLSASDQATAGTYPVIVTNPTPGGGASNSVNFIVNSTSTTTGTFSLVNSPSDNYCAIESGSSTCSFTATTAPAAGDLDEFVCYVPNIDWVPYSYISSVNISGTLNYAIGASIGGYATQPSDTQQTFAYILPSSSGSNSASVVITLSQPSSSAGGYCAFAEYTPSANGSNVGLDTDGSYQPSSPCTSCTNIAPALSGTGTEMLQGFYGTSAYIGASAVSSPYSSNAAFPSDASSASAITTLAPTWTTDSVVPELGEMAFSWNPSPCYEEGFNDWTGGTSGNMVTASGLAHTAKGWQGGQWVYSTGGTDALSYYTWAAFELQNSTGRLCADGGTYPTATPTTGIGFIGNGTTMNEDYVYFNWDMNNFAAPLMSSGLYYWSDLATTDSSHVDCTSLYGFQAHDFISVNCYGDGGNRYFNLEAASGNAPQATVPYYVATGIPASVSGGTITFTGSFIASQWPTGEIIETGQCNGGNGIDLAQFTVTSASSTAITANAGSASGTATGCTIAPWNWLQEVYTSAAGNIPVSGSVSGSTVSFSGRFTCSQWPVGTPFSISNASGGTNYNLSLFQVTSCSSSTITASSTVQTCSGPSCTPTGGTVSGSMTGGTLTGQHVMTIYNSLGTMLGVQWVASTGADFPGRTHIGNLHPQLQLTSGAHVAFGSYKLSLTGAQPIGQ